VFFGSLKFRKVLPWCQTQTSVVFGVVAHEMPLNNGHSLAHSVETFSYRQYPVNAHAKKIKSHSMERPPSAPTSAPRKECVAPDSGATLDTNVNRSDSLVPPIEREDTLAFAVDIPEVERARRQQAWNAFRASARIYEKGKEFPELRELIRTQRNGTFELGTMEELNEV